MLTNYFLHLFKHIFTLIACWHQWISAISNLPLKPGVDRLLQKLPQWICVQVTITPLLHQAFFWDLVVTLIIQLLLFTFSMGKPCLRNKSNGIIHRIPSSKTVSCTVHWLTWLSLEVFLQLAVSKFCHP